MELEFIFQGGGARLGSLIATADSIYEQAAPSKLDFRIAGVAGTSAGAIVAAMLATGQKPSIFKDRIKILIPKYMPSILQNKGKIRSLFEIYLGNPLFNADQYKLFLKELFYVDGLKFKKLKDLENCPIKIICANVENGETIYYSKEDYPETDISEALFHSSALPIFFKNFGDKDPIFDGGMVENLPIGALGSDDGGKAERIAISFLNKEKLWNHSDIKSFLLGLVSGSIELNTERSLVNFPEKNIFRINTKTETLEFDRAAKIDLGEDYERIKSDIASFLRFFTSEKRLRPAKINYETLIQRVSEFHEQMSQKDKLVANDVNVFITPHSLAKRNKDAVDDVEVDLLFTPQSQNVMSISLRIALGTEGQTFDDVKITVLESDDTQDGWRPIGATVLPVSASFFNDEIASSKVIVLFHSTLNLGKSYKLRIKMHQELTLWDLIDSKRMDSASFALSIVEKVENLRIIAYIPNEFEVRLMPFEQKDCFPSTNCVAGKAMDDQALNRWGLAPLGFNSVGWEASNVEKGDEVGFHVLNVS